MSLPQTSYVTDLLYLATLCLSRISVALLIARLTRSKQHLIAARAAAIVTAIWGFAGVLALALRCNLHNPWMYDLHKCPDLVCISS